MKFTAGLLVLAACMPYVAWAGSAAASSSSAAAASRKGATAVAASSAAASSGVGGAAASASSAAASSGSGDRNAAAAASAAAASAGARNAAAATSAAAASSGSGAAAAAAAAATAVAPSPITENRVYCNCPLIYDPVCGSDGVTYSNECVLRCVSKDNEVNCRPTIRLWYHGVCRPAPCICPQVVKPVCGSNNITYTNACYLACDNARCTKLGLPAITLAYEGFCRQATCRCPNCIIPVCGTDGKTYRNICVLQCYSRHNQAQGLPEICVDSTGACKNETCNCALIKKQLCASDDNTYYNQCVLDCQNRRRNQLGLDPLTVQYPGECIKCICPANIDPVCASDRNTYSNECLLACENKKRKCAGLPALTLLWKGPCSCGCTKEWNPVCASDGNTWANKCVLNCENRERILAGLKPLIVLYKGECRRCDCGYCGNRYTPVCGSDGQTHWNICYLKCRSDWRVKHGLSPIWKVADGECC